MAENFLTYTEVDPNSRITVAAQKISFAALASNETAYVYKDMGAGGIAGNYSYNVNVICTGMTGTSMKVVFWSASNTLGEAQSCAGGHTHSLYFWSNTPSIYMEEDTTGGNYNTGYTYATHKEYFITITRNTAVGTYGTIYAYIYADEDRTDLLTTLTLTLHENVNYRYLYALQSANIPTTATGTGYTKSPSTGEVSTVF
jgi:hypothetical protein